MASVKSYENSSCRPAARGPWAGAGRRRGSWAPARRTSSRARSRSAAPAPARGRRRAASGRPSAVSARSMSRATTGSARYPVASVVIEMPSCAPDSWNDSVRWALLHAAVAAVAAAGVGVDGAAFQGGQRELGGHEQRGTRGQNEDGQQTQHGPPDGHRLTPGMPPGPREAGPGVLEEGSSGSAPAGDCRSDWRSCSQRAASTSAWARGRTARSLSISPMEYRWWKYTS